MKTKISNLPMELLVEILCRVGVTSVGAVRSTCKNLNVLTKDQRFANKHIEKAAASQREKEEVLVITGDCKDYLIRVNLYQLHSKNFYPSLKRKGILINREYTDPIYQVFYCNGLLLCLCEDINHRLLVWNPYWGTRRWINCPRESFYEIFAFGYNKSCGRHKILRLSKDDNIVIRMHIEIYDLSSDTWSSLAWDRSKTLYTKPGLSLKGNTYWHAKDIYSEDVYLLCFDFTRERFGPRLPLPSGFNKRCNVSLSSVKEEKLAVLLEPWNRFDEMAVWVTNKIEPDEVSWNNLFKVQTLPINRGFLFGSFLINEEKKTVVVFDRCIRFYNTYLIDGESGQFRKVDLTESPNSRLYNLVGCYIPSSMQI